MFDQKVKNDKTQCMGCSVAGGGTTVLAKKLERNFPQNFMKLVTDVYEKRSAVSLKVESCLTVLLESYWKIIGESWVATLFFMFTT